MTTVHLLHYGSGNLFSVTRALEEVGAEVVAAHTAADVADASRLLIPGVGAFGECMARMRAQGLVEPVLDYARSGRPLLGICVGMQVLFEVGEEFGEHAGLGLIAGRVVPIAAADTHGRPLKVPHIGWNALYPPSGTGPAAGPVWADSVLAEVPVESCAYFVHSFMARPVDPAVELAHVLYGGQRIIAAVKQGNVTGCQFHPEKSGPVGLGILKRFSMA